MLSVKNVSIDFGDRTVLNDISFEVHDGEKVALIGNNGAGKSTLLKIIVGEIDFYEGQILFSRNKRDHFCYIPQRLSLNSTGADLDVWSYMLEGRSLCHILRRIGEIEAASSSNKHVSYNDSDLSEYQTLLDQLQEKGGYKAENDILELLIGVGLGNVDLDQTVVTLSGGQKSRLALARMLYRQSDFLILDEPTNHIDEEAYDWLARYLAHSKQAIILVSHLPDIIDRVVSRVLYLDHRTGHILSHRGGYSSFLTFKVAEAERIQKQNELVSRQATRIKQLIQTAPQSKVGMKHDREKKLEKLERSIQSVPRERTIKIDFPSPTIIRRVTINAERITKSFGNKVVLRDVSLLVCPADRIWIQGENGAGKTTLLRILAGQLEPDSGSVKRSEKLRLGWFRQEQENLNDHLTVLEEVSSVCLQSTRYFRSIFCFRPIW